MRWVQDRIQRKGLLQEGLDVVSGCAGEGAANAEACSGDLEREGKWGVRFPSIGNSRPCPVTDQVIEES